MPNPPQVSNYVGVARVEVQLVSHTEPPRAHAHSLVGRHCTESGTCTLDIGPTDLTASFSNLGILHVTKKGVVEVLSRRLRDERTRQKGADHPLSDSEETSMGKEAKELVDGTSRGRASPRAQPHLVRRVQCSGAVGTRSGGPGGHNSGRQWLIGVADFSRPGLG
ncbi:nuclear factor NF-kappa-B p100 subunit-like [Pseudoliparis swirei]|uniref:nuclear factor NF-kappa-B p100 subunit-like n=1 Tax=Pseudoliparis swirei TaxID=2059687 RepID=UPI0024BDC028|nr:nuclear factor NF-kappa-B p100 subunit-like [Pseudoliparis swirei]